MPDNDDVTRRTERRQKTTITDGEETIIEEVTEVDETELPADLVDAQPVGSSQLPPEVPDDADIFAPHGHLPDPDSASGQSGIEPDHVDATPIGPSVGRVHEPPPHRVQLSRPEQGSTEDQLLWTLLRNRTNAVAFNNYQHFIDRVLLTQDDERTLAQRDAVTHSVPGNAQLLNLGVDGYSVLKSATEFFLMHEAGIIASADDFKAYLNGNPDTPVPLQQRYNKLISGAAEERRQNFRPFNMATWLGDLRNNYYEQLEGSGGLRVLPYFNLIMSRLRDLDTKPATETHPNGYGVLPGQLTGPLGIELIWSYWHEEGMLAQTFGAICNRFQNKRNGRLDPLARMEIDPLRRLNHHIWGWLNAEPFRLSVRRRAYEYDHHYGVKLLGKAVGEIDGADSRSKFIESFHNLLYTATMFHLQDDDLTVQADGFPVLNALRETQLVLTEGAHNQYGDLPWTSRVEMLMQQWMLARPEMREFLGGRVMVPYKEPWMDRVDAVKSMMGWAPTNVTHFRDLGVFGEQILLSVRYGSWAQTIEPEAAVNWARYWRPEIQGYVHAYRAATGKDLRQGVDATMPGLLLQERLATAGAGR